MNMSEEIINDFKILLKSSRLKAGFTYKSLAEASGISSQTLMKYENDSEIDIPTKKLFFLFNILKVQSESIISIIQLHY
jgi:transcriptional regulator with XRE-family HTH domain